MGVRYLVLLCACAAMAPRSAGPPKRGKRGENSGAPRRITSDSVKSTGLSLKTQLNLVRAVNNKKAGEAPRERRKVNKAGGAKKKADDGSAARNASGPALYERTLLLVDGYNAIFGDEGLNALSKGPGGLDGAREALLRGCDVLCESRNWDGLVCFDAHSTADPLATSRSGRLKVVYTAEQQTADAFLEAAACERKGLGEGATVVASNDGMVRLMATAQGAGTMRITSLMDAVAGADAALASRLGSIRQSNALPSRSDGEYDPLADLAERHVGEGVRRREAEEAAVRGEVTALLNRVADGDGAARAALADLERRMTPALRASFDGEKRLLGLMDLLRPGWHDDDVEDPR